MFELMPFDRRSGSIFNYFDNLEKEFFQNMNTTVSAIRTDILEEDDRFVVKAELPGMNKEDIHISVDDGRLTVSACHKQESEEKKDNYIRRERREGSFQRSFDITGIDAAKIEAEYKDGVLVLNLPKAAPEAQPTYAIEIK